MTKIISIKQKIKQLEGGKFQAFCDALLARKGYKKIYSLGAQSGTMKTTIGNPDTYFISESGKYIFVAYTTEQAGINKKIEADILKCLDKSKTGVNISEIEEIICCHTSDTLNAGKDNELRELCRKKGVLLDLYGIDRISNEVYQHYPMLAKEFLGEAVDTGQIFTYSDFVEKNDSNEMTSPLATEFLFRDNELNDLVDKVSQSKVVVIFGKPGVGKTRLAIEGCKKFSELHGYEIFCIKSNDMPIFEDLTTYILPNKSYVLFVDDANELKGLKHALEYLVASGERRSVKIVATVRDYAREFVEDEIKKFTLPERMELKKSTDKEIEEILGVNLGIKNRNYLDQIIRIAEGNPRIAFLAGRLAVEENNLQSIRDVSQLYENYYGRLIKGSGFETDKHVRISAGIVALLDFVNLQELNKLEALFRLFSISSEQFREGIEHLHRQEFVDIHYDRVVKISDQCFSNYILYHVFFVEKVIPLSTILDFCFRNFKKQISRALITVTHIFYTDSLYQYINDAVDTVWSRFESEDDVLFFEFIKLFCALKPTDTFLYVTKRIDDLDEEIIDLSTFDFEDKPYRTRDEIVVLLSSYRDSENWATALELMISYCQKKQTAIIDVINAMSGCIDKDSSINNYFSAVATAKALVNYCDVDEITLNLFVRVSKELLKLKFDCTEDGRNRTVTFYWVRVELAEGSKEYRGCIWKKLIELLYLGKCENEIMHIIDKYSNNFGRGNEVDIEMLSFDMPFIKKLIIAKNTLSVFKKEKICHQLVRMYRWHKIDSDVCFDGAFESKEWKIYSLVKDRDTDELDYMSWSKKRKKEIGNYALNCNLKELKEFIATCNDIAKINPNEDWQISKGIDLFFEALVTRSEEYVIAIGYLFENCENLEIFLPPKISVLINYMGVQETFKMIYCREYKRKERWLFDFFSLLPKEEVNEFWVFQWFEFLKSDIDKNITQSTRRDISFLNKVLGNCPDIFIQSSKIILKKFEYNPFIATIYFECFFHEEIFTSEKLINIFDNEIELLQEIYFKMISNSKMTDYSGMFIKDFIEVDESWLLKYIDYAVIDLNYGRWKENNRICACWSSEDFQGVFHKLFYRIAYEDVPEWDKIGFFESLLKDNVEAKNKINWLKHIIYENYSKNEIELIFKIISQLSVDVIKECIQYFASLNKDYEFFEKLQLRPLSSSWSGSRIPVLEKEIEFFESLLPIFTGLDFLKHRKFVENEIGWLRCQIKEEEINEIQGW